MMSIKQKTLLDSNNIQKILLVSNNLQKQGIENRI